MVLIILFNEIKTWIKQFVLNICFKTFFLIKGSYLKKTLHCQGLKYISVGSKTRIDKNCRIDCYKSQNCKPNFVLGNNVMIGFNVTFLISTDLIIGDNVLIASNVFASTENHGIDPLAGKYLNQELISKPIYIENNVWIGERVTILPGVTIGEYSIIGANSVVTKSIPSYSIAVGNPAKIIKKFNFDEKKWVSI